MVEMTIDSIRVSLMNYQRVVILKEKGTNRYLPIWIGPAEADAIAVKLQNVELSRPLTHDLLQSVISALGASVEYIVVNGLKEDTFYARLALNIDGEQMISQVDERGEERRGYVSFLWGDSRYVLKIEREWREADKRFVEALNENDGLVFELCHDEVAGMWLLTKLEVDSRPSDALALAVRVGAPIYAEESVLEKAGIILDEETGKSVSEGKSEAKVDEQELQGLSAYKDFINTLDLEDFKKRQS